MKIVPAFVFLKEIKASVAPVSPLRPGIEPSAHTRQAERCGQFLILTVYRR